MGSRTMLSVAVLSATTVTDTIPTESLSLVISITSSSPVMDILPVLFAPSIDLIETSS